MFCLVLWASKPLATTCLLPRMLARGPVINMAALCNCAVLFTPQAFVCRIQYRPCWMQCLKRPTVINMAAVHCTVLLNAISFWIQTVRESRGHVECNVWRGPVINMAERGRAHINNMLLYAYGPSMEIQKPCWMSRCLTCLGWTKCHQCCFSQFNFNIGR